MGHAVLFLRNEDGRLFDFAPVAATAAAAGDARLPRPSARRR